MFNFLKKYFEKEPEGYWGAWDSYDEEDWQLCAGQLDLPTPRHTFLEIQAMYQQTETSRVSCTEHGPLTSISNLTAYKLNEAQRSELWNLFIKKGADPAVGWGIKEGTKTAVKWFNAGIGKELGITLVYFRVSPGDEEYTQAIERGYMPVVGYAGNRAFNIDRQDGMIDGISFGPKTYGHCHTMSEDLANRDNDLGVDNYIKTLKKKNVFKIPDANMEPLRLNGTYFNSAYVIAIKEDMGNLERKVSPWALKSAEKAKEKGIINNWDNPQEKIAEAGSTLEYVLHKLGGLTKTGEVVTKERLAVALDNLHLLD